MMTDVMITLKRAEISALKRVLIKEARWLSGCSGTAVDRHEQELDDLRQVFGVEDDDAWWSVPPPPCPSCHGKDAELADLRQKIHDQI